MVADEPLITISIVSHDHNSLVLTLLDDLNAFTEPNIEVLLTFNTVGQLPVVHDQYRFPITFIQNKVRKGFGSNHNAAFKYAKGEYFCVLNPDIRLKQNPFPALLVVLDDIKVGVVAPQVLDGHGQIEDSARPFPSIGCLMKKLLGLPACARYPDDRIPHNPDWVAGMFMLFRGEAFRELGGFDERYFMYYEDVDICARLRIHGWKISYCEEAHAEHHARRDSHRTLRFLIWHVSSMFRFFLSPARRAVLE